MTLILIVEDSLDNQILLEEVLSDSGYTIYCVDDGASALHWLSLNRPDLILLDLSLPEIDGWEIARRIRQNPEMASLPIIAITAHAMKGDRELILSSGFNSYIPKPIDIGEVEIQVGYWLDKAINCGI